MRKTMRLFVCLALALVVAVLSHDALGGEKTVMIIGVPDTPPTVDHEVGAATTIQYMLLDNIQDCGSNWTWRPSTEPGMDFVLVPDMNIDNLQPVLLEKWEVSDDGRTATYHIRKGVKSPWGNELTADDYEWKFQRHMAMGAVGKVWMVANDVIEDGQVTYKKIDKYTFSVTSGGQNALHKVITSGMFDQVWDSVEAKKNATPDDPFATQWVARTGAGFGPYYITSWEAGQQIVIEENPNYWDKDAVKIKKVIFKVIPESSNRVAMIRSGEIDIATELSPREINSLQKARGVKVVNILSNAADMLILNQKTVPAFADVKVRQAVNFAIPHEEIIKKAYYGQAAPWRAVYASLFGGTLPDSEWMYSYDIAKAKKLMAESSFPNGFNVELYYNSDWPAHESVGILLRDSLAQLGINVDLRSTPAGTFDTLTRSHTCPFAILHEYAALPNGVFQMNLHYLSVDKGGSYGGFGHYSNEKVDNLLAAAGKVADQREVSAAAQRELMETAPYGFLVETNYTAAIRDNIVGFNWDVGMGTKFKLMSFK